MVRRPAETPDIRTLSLVDILASRASEHGERIAFHFLTRTGGADREMSFEALDRHARTIAVFLGRQGAPGDRVLLLYPPGLEYVAAFMGCLYAGRVAVPLYPPRPNQKYYRAGEVLLDCGAEIALTETGARASIAAYLAGDKAFAHIRAATTDNLPEADGAAWHPPQSGPDTLAFLQYTSGSTGTPKGVMVSHGNIVANQRTMVAAGALKEEDIFVSWLPIYHDMGLIGAILQTIFTGLTTVLLSPTDFIRDPTWWLEVISARRGTISGGPNFAYELCCDHISRERLDTLDLSCWRAAFNGAEPVRAATLERFAATFAPAGFHPRAFYPCYGMAESTLFISGGDHRTAPTIGHFDREGLARNRAIAKPANGESMALVSCGSPQLPDKVIIVHPKSRRRCLPGRIGEIWVQSTGMALGYWQRPEETQATFRATTASGAGPYLRTGDLGFLENGEIFVTGRLKDLIILRGRNYYPQDLELTAQRAHPALQPEACAAFGVMGESGEQLILVTEVRRSHLRDLDSGQIFEAVRAAVSEAHEVAVGQILLLKPGRIFKTSSGKIRRRACREAFEAGTLATLASHTPATAATTSEPQLDRQSLLASKAPQALIAERLHALVAARLSLRSDSFDPDVVLTSLGLDSMALITLQHALELELGIHLSIDVFLEGKTLTELAAVCWDKVYENHRADSFGHEPADRFPLAPNQLALWHSHQLAPGSAAYHLPFAALVHTPLDVEALEEAFRSLLDRHRMLRGRFPLQAGEVSICIEAEATLAFSLIDATDWQPQRVQAYLTTSARRPFDLERGPLMRLDLLRLSDDRHCLLWNLHHLAGDMWSLLLLLDELRQIYGHRGERALLAPQPLDYADFVVESRAFPESGTGQRQWAFWRDKLAGELPVLELPCDFPRPPQQTHNGATHACDLGARLSADLRQMACVVGTTPMTVLLAGFQLLLHRISGQEDLLVGIPDSGRAKADYRHLVGYFINPLAIRSVLLPHLTWRAFLAQTDQSRREAMANASFPFQSLLERLAPKRIPGRPPIFQVMFSLQEPHQLAGAGSFALRQAGARLSLGELDLESVPLEPGTSQFEMTLFAAETGSGFAISLEYNTDLFHEQTAARLMDLWQNLLSDAVAHPDRPVERLSPVSGETRTILLEKWNDTERRYPDNRPLPQRLLARADETPEALAVSCTSGSLTYGELKQRALYLAGLLRDRGIGPESRVAVCCDRRAFLVEAALAVLLAGATYVPLDPGHPPERLAFIISDCGAQLVLAPPDFTPLLPPGVAILPPDSPAGDTCRPYHQPFHDERLAAYIIYTSGSTGKPKGVCTPYGGLANLVDWHIATFNLERSDRCGMTAATGFDASVWELWPCLVAGASLHLLPVEASSDLEFLVSWLHRERISVVFLTTRLGVALMDHVQRLKNGDRRSPLRYLLVGGEKLQAYPRDLPFALLNAYGPTENTVVSTAVVLDPNGSQGPPPIGTPNPNVTAYVLDRLAQLVPIGAVGELYLGGASLARGYIGLPDLTAERFVPNPFSRTGGSRLYRSGDRVRHDRVGSIHFLGRVDSQVKLRGFRIEPEEVAHWLTRLPSVTQALVIASDQGAASGQLVAYVIPSGADFSAEAARTYLARQLPAFMVPAAYVPLETWPLTPNGKIDRAALPVPGRQHLATAARVTPPRNGIEARLCEIWAEVLGLEQVGIDDNYFELGGDSILAIQIQTRCARAGLSLSPAQLFQYQTIGELAGVLGSSAVLLVGTEPGEGPIQPSPIQEWFLRAQSPAPHHFNQSVLLEVAPSLEAETLQRALDQLHRHHDALRLAFTPAGIHYDRERSTPVRTFALEDGDEAANRALVLEMTAALQRSLHLAQGPLMAAALFLSPEPEPHLLFLTIHHLVVDGVSWRILLEDLGALLNGQTLPPKTSSFGAWSERLPQARLDVSYWLNLLPTPPFAVAPEPDRPQNEGSGESENQELALDPEFSAALAQMPARVFRTGLHEVLMTALCRALAENCGHHRLLLDLESHGRAQIFDHIDLSRTLGWFTCVYPVAIHLSKTGDPAEDLLRVKEQSRHIKRGGLDYALARTLPVHEDLARQLARLPRSRVVFNYLGRFDTRLPPPLIRRRDWKTGPDRAPGSPNDHLLAVDAMLVEEGLRLNFSYPTHCFRSETVKALAKSVENQLRSLLDTCTDDAPRRHTPSDFPLAELDQAALDELCAHYPGLTDVYPLAPTQEGMLFHALFHRDSHAYFEQLHCRLEGELDTDAFQRAWHSVVHNNPALAAAFRWEGLKRPLQVVDSEAIASWQVEDLCELTTTERERRLKTYLHTDRRRGFALHRAPLMRFALMRTGRTHWSFVWSYHHLLLDGWSLGLVLKEVFAAYRAWRAGTVPIPVPRPLFRDFIAAAAEQDQQRASRFWKDLLAGFRAPLVLPMDAGTPSGSMGHEEKGLSRRTCTNLEGFARGHGLTLSTCIQAAWSLLLARYCRCEDVVFGLTVSGRENANPDLPATVGLLINTVPVRVRCDRSARLEGWLIDLQRSGLAIGPHAGTSLAQIQSWSDFPSGQELFDTLLVVENYPLDTAELQRDLDLVIGETRAAAYTHYGLTLVARTHGDLVFQLAYDTGRFQRTAMSRLLVHLETLLTALPAHLDSDLGALPLLPDAERERLLQAWNQAIQPARSDTVQQLFAARARQQPAREALTFPAHRPEGANEDLPGRSLTYGQLYAAACRLAERLRARGATGESLVGLHMERSPELVVGILGILLAGAAYVPLDPVYPADRLAYMIADAGLRLVVCGDEAPKLAAASGEIERVPVNEHDFSAQPPNREPAPAPSPLQIAYVIYTSGSTGKPKGVPVPHANVARLFSSTAPWFDFSEDDVWTLFHSYAFDFTVWELWGALIHGGRLVIVPHLTARSPEAFHRLLNTQRVTVLNQTPSAFVRLVTVDENAPHPARHLRYVIFGGEALEPRILMPWFRRHGDREPRLVNMYGITETTVHVTWRPMIQADTGRAGSNIGTRIPDLTLYLLDEGGEPVPQGVPGEIFVGGAGLARGYLGRPDLTASRFLPNPFSQRPGERLYRTGDLGRYDDGGDLEYAGRCDFQVKIRGYRIELGEIEAALTGRVGIRQAIVMVREDLPGLADKQLVAYLVVGRQIDIDDLHKDLRKSLPDYMVPGHFVFLDELPLTAHGKVDREQLPLPSRGEARGDRDYVAPRNRVERQLAEIWAEVLGVEKVGIHDRFFELGGDSILSIRVMSGAKARGLSLSLAALFEHQTIAKLSPLVARSAITATVSHEPFAQLAERDRAALPEGCVDAYPTTRLQAGMFFHGEMEADAYHNLTSIVLRAPFDETKLRAACDQLVDRHPVLRTAFDLHHFSIPMQLVFPAIPSPATFHDWRQLEDQARAKAFDAWFDERKHHRFDWAQPGLFRLYFHRFDEERFAVTLMEHHAILDGWSVATLLTELFSLYLTGEAPPPPTTGFSDYVALERSAQEDPATRRYWADRLDGFELARIPREIGADRGPAHLEVPIAETLALGLERLATKLQVPLKSMMLAVHLRVLSLLSGHQDVVTGLVSNGRPEEGDSQRTLGLFLNTLPFRHRFAGETWRELIEGVFRAERQSLAFRRFPLADMQKMLAAGELFDTAFNYTHFHVTKTLRNVAGLELEAMRFHAPTHLPFAANFSRDLTSGRVQLSLDYRADIFPLLQAQAIAGHYLTAMSHLLEKSEASCRRIPFLSGAEREKVLETWNKTEFDHHPPAALQDLVIDQARRSPNQTALVSWTPDGKGETLTYAALMDRACRLAHHLVDQGAGPERPVAICLERSPDAIVAIIAALLAGSPYLPLDPTYPEERLAFMLRDSGTALVVGPARLAAYCQVVDLDAERACIASCPTDPPAVVLGPRHAAYIIYTSGSTGTPKGVVISHGAILNQILWRQKRFDLSAGDRLLQNLSLSFDPSVWQIFWPLSIGAQLFLVPADCQRDIPWMARTIREQRLAATAMVPSVLQLLLQEPDFLACAHLKHISCGGEALPGDLVSRFCEHFGENGILHVVYGPTEATIDAATWHARRDVPTPIAPIGYPIHNARIYVLDPFLEPVPVGVPGELYIAGGGLARGYLNRPDLTADRYLPNPFEPDGQRLYRTGDMVRLLEGGLLEFRGRADHQVKVRGFRIELGEVEAVLTRYPGVAEVVCLVREDRPGDKRLVAYLTGNAKPEDVRQWLAGRVPEYMVPATFVLLDSFPRLPNDKVNRRLLPAPEEADRRSEATYAPPANEREATLARIWAEVLGLERVGIHDNFFELGGDSILCIQVIARARETGFQLTPQLIFAHPTVAELAMTSGDRIAAEQGEVTGFLPLTPIQHWFFEEVSSTHFNQAVLLTVPADLDPAVLQLALDRLADHHDALRLRFVREPETGWQQQHAAAGLSLPLEIHHWRGQRESWAPKIAELAARAHTSFDLQRAPLVRALFMHFQAPDGTAEARLLLVAHHLIVDGVSWRFLLEDLQVLCRRGSRQVELPAKTSSYKLWSARLADHARSQDLQAEAAYWLEQPEVAAPFDEAATRIRTGEARHLDGCLDAETTEQLLRQVPQAYKTRVEDVLLAALAEAWRDWSGGSDLLVALESHGRESLFEEVDHSRTVGWFTAAYPLLLSLPGRQSPGLNLKTSKETLRRVPRGGIGYGLLRFLHPTLGPQLAARRRPPISFNYLGQIEAGIQTDLFSLAPEPTGPHHDPALVRPYPIEFNGFVSDDRLQWTWTYAPEVSAKAPFAELALRFDQALKALIGHCLSCEAGGRTPSDFALASLDQEALDALVGNGRDVADLYPLAPLQQGMLFHTLSEPDSGLYHQQLCFELQGRLNRDALVAAWDRLIERHDIFRTAFFHEGLEQPLQRVHHRATALWHFEDLPDGSDELDAYLERDRRRGFALGNPPLMRFALLCSGRDSWYFIWSHHHILLDGWSLPIVLSELQACYEACDAGIPPELAQPRPFRAYIAWLTSQEPADAEAWWRAYLAGFQGPTALPAWGTASGGHASASLPLDASLTATLHQFGQTHQLTLNTLCAGAWSLLLACFAGETDVVFGQTVSGRSAPVPGIQQSVGLFINTLPMRVRLQWERPIVNWLKELQTGAADRETYSWCALTDIARWSDMAAGAGLFDSILVFENYPIDPALHTRESALRWSLREMRERANFPLVLAVLPGDRPLLQLTYDSGRFEADLAARLLGYFHNGLSALAADPQRLLGHISLLDEAERARLLHDFNDTALDLGPDLPLHHLFQQRAAAHPDRIALTCDQPAASLTYRELNGRANGLARRLRELGIGPESIVGVCLERTPELIVALLAIVKAGGAYLTIDPELPAGRLRTILADAEPALLIVTSGLSDRFAGIPQLSPDALTTASEWPPDLESGICPTAALYYIFTSGSTGTPKASVNLHRGLVNFCRFLQERHPLTAADRVALVASYSFDIFSWEFWWPLSNGAGLALLPSGGLNDLFHLRSFIQESRISVIHLIPSILQALLESLGDEPFVSDLRLVFSGGEALPSETGRRVLSQLRGKDGSPDLVQIYGPSEASIISTLFNCGRNPLGGPIPIGTPLANTVAYVTDRRLRLVPVDAPGELLIAGRHLARGYHRRPDLTAASFIANPFSGEAGDRLYRTGDLVRMRADGAIVFLGRIDHQVKLRGLRVEIGEIEAQLSRHAAVSEALVLLREREGGEPLLVAYVRGAASPETDLASELTDFLRDQLPAYMIPSAFIPIDSWPRLHSGKVDRQALARLPHPSLELGNDTDQAPRNPLEETLAATWCSVLGLDRIGIHDNFFALGGHSLLATRAISQIKHHLQVEVPYKQFFSAPTVAATAVWISRQKPATTLPAIRPVARTSAPPLSHAQQRLWFLDQLEENTAARAAYNLMLALNLTGDLDEAALQRAVVRLGSRHETLRTNFREQNGQPVQVIHPIPSLALVQGEALDEAEFKDIIQREITRCFDLAQDPLLRLVLVRQSRDRHVLLIGMHHIISDGWSMGILVEELAALYRSECAGEPVTLPALPVQYADFSHWQREQQVMAHMDRQARWWREKLDGLPLLHQLPTDRPRPPIQTNRGDRLQRDLEAAALGRLDEVARQSGTTRFMTLLSTFNILLARYSGSRDIVVGTPIANRNHAEIEPLIGFFVNTLVLRVEVDPDARFAQLLDRVRQTALDAYAHQDVPFERVVEVCRPERSLSYGPLFQIMFTLQNMNGNPVALPGLTLTPLPIDNRTAKFDLSLTAFESVAGLTLEWEYNTDLFDEASVARMADHLQHLLRAIPDHTQTTVATLPLSGIEERRRLLSLCNQRRSAPVTATCIQELFEAQVRRTPHAAALLFENQEWSYHDLNRLANRLAHHLISLGVGPETNLGIAGRRSSRTVLGLLGILKAGAAYVPLDPSLPAERLSLMIGQSALPLILSPRFAASDLCGFHVPLLDLDEVETLPPFEENPPLRNHPDHLAYIIYTSGSTGNPKGVAVPHRGVIRLVEKPHFTTVHPGDSVLQFVPLSFDVSSFELWMPLAHGGRLCIYPDGPPDLAELGTFLGEHRIAVAWLTTGLFNQMVDLHLADLGALRQILAGGDQLSLAHVRRFLEAHPDIILTNGYGPTENTTLTTSHTMDAADLDRGVLIGQPLDHTTAYVLDEHLEPVPIGVAGELLTGGAGLARGYVGDPALTAERFVPHSHPTSPGERLYRTGDLVRVFADGNLAFIGRQDGQVKIRGYRIEVGEIEHALLRHPRIEKAAVIARSDLPGGKALVAFLQFSSGPEPAPDLSQLRAFLQERLPAFMVPAQFNALERMPLNSNGKLDRAVLARTSLTAVPPMAAVTFVAPRDAAEIGLARIWCEVLGQEKIGIHDNFFELGGHSLLATSLVARIRTRLELNLPVRAVFEHPTVAAMAAHMTTLEADPDGTTAGPLDPIGVLSASQARLWGFFKQYGPTPTYNVSMGLRIQGRLRVPALTAALTAMIERHESLRTSFGQQAGEAPFQKVHPAGPAHLHTIDMDGEAESLALLKREALHLFDLERDPLLRFTLVRLKPEHHLLCINMHHIITDGWSMGVFIREATLLYAAYAADPAARGPILPPPVMQFPEYARRERSYLGEEKMQRQLAWWQRELRDLPELNLPLDFPRPQVPNHEAGLLSFRLDPRLSNDLKAFANRHSASLFMVLTAAFALMLSRHSGQKDFAVGTPIAGRRRSEWEGLIGFMVGGLLLRTRLEGPKTFAALVDHLRQVALDAYAHQDVPFTAVAEAFQQVHGSDRQPLLQVMISLQNLPMTAVSLPQLEITPLELEVPAAKYDLILALGEQGDALTGQFIYRRCIFKETTARTMLQDCLYLLAQGSANPDEPLNRLDEPGSQPSHPSAVVSPPTIEKG